MNNLYDRLAQLIINKILLCFGLRLKTDGELIFMYRIRNYTGTDAPDHMSLIKTGGNIEDAFLFLNMDYTEFKKKKFQTTIEFTSWFTENCPYITVELIKHMEREVNSIPLADRNDLQRATLRFVDTIRIGHILLKDFKFLPIYMYPNLREKIVRNFFQSEEVDNQIIDAKLKVLGKDECKNKFSPKLVITWLPELRSKSKLTGLVTRSFVDYITKNNEKLFPRFLVDTDPVVVRQEVLSFYYNLFPKTDAYKLYVTEEKEIDEVASASQEVVVN